MQSFEFYEDDSDIDSPGDGQPMKCGKKMFYQRTRIYHLDAILMPEKVWIIA
jgi:hypothetical protein